MKLIGPFTQLLTMDHLPAKGVIADDQLEIINDAGVLVNDEGILAEVGTYASLEKTAIQNKYELERPDAGLVALPGFVDSHTHLCWAGSRAADYAGRLAGKSYLEIAHEGGGIWSTVKQVRNATLDELKAITAQHAGQMLADGVTTIEVKSGYGLTVEDELKMLEAIRQAACKADLVSTCLAAHIVPRDFEAGNRAYLELMATELLPEVKRRQLSNRVDAFVEDSAFSVAEARDYLTKAKVLDFDLVIHGDQFSVGGSQLAIEMGAVSVDHLEATDDIAIKALQRGKVIVSVLPGASLGLGIPFAPGRKLLDAGLSLVIASDWNPGSAPMGDLLMQAAIFGIYEKLTMAETLAAITVRAASALNLNDRGVLKKGNIADLAAFPVSDYREIIYRQGKLKPHTVWKKGSSHRSVSH